MSDLSDIYLSISHRHHHLFAESYYARRRAKPGSNAGVAESYSYVRVMGLHELSFRVLMFGLVRKLSEVMYQFCGIVIAVWYRVRGLRTGTTRVLECCTRRWPSVLLWHLHRGACWCFSSALVCLVGVTSCDDQSGPKLLPSSRTKSHLPSYYTYFGHENPLDSTRIFTTAAQ